MGITGVGVAGSCTATAKVGKGGKVGEAEEGWLQLAKRGNKAKEEVNNKVLSHIKPFLSSLTTEARRTQRKKQRETSFVSLNKEFLL